MIAHRIAIWVIAALIFCQGAFAIAQSVTVAGGDHVDFTRLTFSGLPEGAWSLETVEGGLQLRAGNSDIRFDTGRAFDKITRDRVTALQANGPDLIIGLACECHAVTSQWRDTYLVIDVKPGPDPDAAQAAPSASAGLGAGLGLPLVPGLPERSTLPNADSQMTRALDYAASERDRITQLETDLAQSLARAATQGLLQPAAGHSRDVEPGSLPAPVIAPLRPRNGSASPGEGSRAPVDTNVTEDGPPPSEPPYIGITAQTSIDRDMGLRLDERVPLAASPQCLPSDWFDMTDWIDDRGYSAQIAERRAALTTELDRIPADAAEQLARTYLAFGFGSEAVQAAKVDGVMSQERRLLITLGAIIDGEPLPFDNLARQIECDTGAALWAFVASSVDHPLFGSDPGVILRTFQVLPEQLQMTLAPRLAERFLAIGDQDSADAVLNRFAPVQSVASTDAGIASAALAGRISGAQAEIDALSAIARGDIRMTPNALIDLLNLAGAEGREPAADLIELAAAFRFEYRRDPIYPKLLAAEARLLVDLGRFDDSLDLLDGAKDLAGADLVHALKSETVQRMTDSAGDVAFLGRVLTDRFDGITTEAQNAVARRLIVLGLPDKAAGFLVSPSSGASASERRYLRAEIALDQGDAQGAVRLLNGLTDQRAAALRARALRMEGSIDAAYSARLVAPGASSDQEMAWAAGAWSDLARGDDPVLRDAGTAMLSVETPTIEGASLSAGQAALDEAAKTRALIDTLLTRYPRPGT